MQNLLTGIKASFGLAFGEHNIAQASGGFKGAAFGQAKRSESIFKILLGLNSSNALKAQIKHVFGQLAYINDQVSSPL